MAIKEVENDVNEQLIALLNEDSILESLKVMMSDKSTIDRLKRARNFAKQNQELFFILRQQVKGNKRFETFIDALFYMFQFEVYTSLNVDFLMFLLMEKNSDFSLNYERRKTQTQICSVDDLFEIPLGTKLDYLASKKNKIDCFRKYAKTTLRNKIAHMDFKIDEEGHFFIYDALKGFEEINLKEALTNLANLNSMVQHKIAGTRNAVLNKK
jgi:hypothetical protein